MKTTIALSSMLAAATLVAPMLVIGCASKNTANEDQDSVDSSEAAASSAQASRLDQMIFSPVSTADPVTAAAQLSAATQWWPAGCATRSKDATDPKVVHVHLAECSGPFGLRHWTGDITITFSAGTSGGLHAEAASSDMTVNGHAVTWERHADLSYDATSNTITVNGAGAWTRETDAGLTVSHSHNGTTTIDIAAQCRTTDGTATTMVGAREVDATASGYKVCRDPATGVDECPSGTVTYVHKASGNTVTVTFDGSAEAKITGPRGNSVDVPLVCGT